MNNNIYLKTTWRSNRQIRHWVEIL